MANDSQFRTRTRIVATRGVCEYRETIPSRIRAEDVVLEVGCGWRTTTAELARHAYHVLGTDVCRECIMGVQGLHPTLDFRVLDAFDLRAVLGLAKPPSPGFAGYSPDFAGERSLSAVYMDLSGLSGYRGLLDLIARLGALKHFARYCLWRAGRDRRTVWGPRERLLVLPTPPHLLHTVLTGPRHDDGNRINSSRST